MNSKKITLIMLTFLSSILSGWAEEPLAIGDPAPQIKVTTDTAETIELGELYKKGAVLIYFYPKSDTPGCTKQACNLRDHFADLKEEGITVLGVSIDSVASQSKFKKKYNLPFALVADEDKKLGDAFGIKNRGGLFYSRQSFLIIDGKIAWRDLKATPVKQAQDALAALKANKG